MSREEIKHFSPNSECGFLKHPLAMFRGCSNSTCVWPILASVLIRAVRDASPMNSIWVESQFLTSRPKGPGGVILNFDIFMYSNYCRLHIIPHFDGLGMSRWLQKTHACRVFRVFQWFSSTEVDQAIDHLADHGHHPQNIGASFAGKRRFQERSNDRKSKRPTDNRRRGIFLDSLQTRNGRM